MRLAILTSHPIQYYAPLFRELSSRIAIKVFFAHRATPAEQAAAGFGTAFEWDVDLLQGYNYEFLQNTAKDPGTHRFAGCDTPQIRAKLVSEHFDALLVTGWHLKCYWQGIWAAKSCGIPVMVRGDSQLNTPRNPAKRLVKRVAYPTLLRAFNGALYVGQRNLDYWRYYDYPDDRLFFSPHCVDNEYFAQRATGEARKTIRMRFGIHETSSIALFAGKLVEFKRPIDLVRAARRVRSQGLDLQVLIAGSGQLKQSICSEAANLGVPVHFMGFQNQSEMPGAYAAGDFLVLPSDGRESWGLVANEALACGRPVVVSDAVGCAPDLAGDQAVGRIFPLGDIQALAEAMTSIAHRPLLTEPIRKQSIRYGLASAAEGVVSAASRIFGERLLAKN